MASATFIPSGGYVLGGSAIISTLPAHQTGAGCGPTTQATVGRRRRIHAVNRWRGSKVGTP